MRKSLLIGLSIFCVSMPVTARDEEMNLILSPDMHRVCTGPADKMILADTVGYHRGGKPRSRNRVLLTFTYTSAWQTKSGPRIAGTPSWSMNGMQRMALLPAGAWNRPE